MKIRIKETGELLEDVKFIDTTLHKITIQYLDDGVLRECSIKNLSDIEEVKDYEESKEYWFIDAFGNIIQNKLTKHRGDTYTDMLSDYEMQKFIGNHFETPEEAEKTVEKLKAWKRLKDKGFRFVRHSSTADGVHTIEYIFDDDIPVEPLDLLFGGEG